MMTEGFGNPHSRTHQRGSDAAKAVQKARTQVADVVDADPAEVIFTSGGTESNNLAILGLENALRKRNKTHIITSAIEHKAILEPIDRLKQHGFKVTYVPPNTHCIVNPNDIANALTDETGLVSIMAVNNEIGSIQPLAEIATVLADHSAYFHTDAAQAFGKEIDLLRNDRIDLISISGHKICAPMGSGALITRRRGYERIPLKPLIIGGGQERGIRGGTVSAPLAAGIGLAADLALTEHSTRNNVCNENFDKIVSFIDSVNGVYLTSCAESSSFLISFRLPGINANSAIVALRDLVAISTGSACTSADVQPSHVLKAMGVKSENISGVMRWSWGHIPLNFPTDELLSQIKRLL